MKRLLLILGILLLAGCRGDVVGKVTAVDKVILKTQNAGLDQYDLVTFVNDKGEEEKYARGVGEIEWKVGERYILGFHDQGSAGKYPVINKAVECDAPLEEDLNKVDGEITLPDIEVESNHTTGLEPESSEPQPDTEVTPGPERTSEEIMDEVEKIKLRHEVRMLRAEVDALKLDSAKFKKWLTGSSE